jgi:tetratricopeptide (TPR) repeat protein
MNTGRRVALVIGNNQYHNQQPLRNSINDATAVGSALRELGFTTDVRLDVSVIQMEKVAGRFVASVRPGDIALFYYSGHGMQVSDQNYLIPVDFDALTAADAKYKAYAAARMQENLEAAGASLQILILDACRDNPYRSVRGAGGGLAAMQAGKSTYIAFATAPGRTADDNASGKNGLFTGALLEALRQPGLTLDQVFNRVRASVSSSRSEQVPWSASSVVGEFYFRDGQPDAATADLPPFLRPLPAQPKREQKDLGCMNLGSKSHAMFVEAVSAAVSDDWDRAIHFYKQTIYLDNKCVDAYYNRGSAYYQRSLTPSRMPDDRQNAIDDFDNNLKMHGCQWINARKQLRTLGAQSVKCPQTNP